MENCHGDIQIGIQTEPEKAEEIIFLYTTIV